MLVSYEDITAKVAAATKGLDDKAANDTRKKTLTQLEQACEQASRKDRKTGPLKCESVNLYKGGQYWLYKYKRYDDVRLVFAPENAHRAVRRRPGQLPVPALVPRHVGAARVRERQARRHAELPEDRLQGPGSERAGVRRRATRARRTGCSPSRS